MPTFIDIGVFAINTAIRSDGGLIDLVSIREDDNIFNRIGFRFDSAFDAADSFNAGSSIDVLFATTSSIVSSDFDGLPLYWGIGPDANNSHVGPIAGQVSAVPEPSAVLLIAAGTIALAGSRQRKRH